MPIRVLSELQITLHFFFFFVSRGDIWEGVLFEPTKSTARSYLNEKYIYIYAQFNLTREVIHYRWLVLRAHQGDSKDAVWIDPKATKLCEYSLF